MTCRPLVSLIPAWDIKCYVIELKGANDWFQSLWMRSVKSQGSSCAEKAALPVWQWRGIASVTGTFSNEI